MTLHWFYFKYGMNRDPTSMYVVVWPSWICIYSLHSLITNTTLRVTYSISRALIKINEFYIRCLTPECRFMFASKSTKWTCSCSFFSHVGWFEYLICSTTNPHFSVSFVKHIHFFHSKNKKNIYPIKCMYNVKFTNTVYSCIIYKKISSIFNIFKHFFLLEIVFFIGQF